MTKITVNEVRKVASLARLKLKEENISLYTDQLEKILDYIAHLEQVDTTDVPPTMRAVEVTNITRKDLIQENDIREELLDLAPHREGDFFRVPKILSD